MDEDMFMEEFIIDMSDDELIIFSDSIIDSLEEEKKSKKGEEKPCM